MTPSAANDQLQIRIHPSLTPDAHTLVYLPGMHGDWTLIGGFRHALGQAVRFVEFTYPRTPSWSLEDYATAIRAELRVHGITRAWLLAESFGSQIAWALLARSDDGAAVARFQVEGVVLAGGFVRYPWPTLLRAGIWFFSHVPARTLRTILRAYNGVARWPLRGTPGIEADLAEFVARRTPLDLSAAVHRLRLIQTAQPDQIAARCQIPIHFLAGLMDPMVPCPIVRRWLRRHAPAYRGGRTFLLANHQVLGTAPRACAQQVLEWIRWRKRGSP